MENHKKYLESLVQRTLSFKGRFFLIHCDYNLPLSMNVESSDWVINYLTPYDTIILGSDATDTDFEFCKNTAAQIIFVSDQPDQKYLKQGLVDIIVHDTEFEDLLVSDIFNKSKFPTQTNKTAALFLDRDGVIINFEDYLKDHTKVILRDGIIDIIKSARKSGLKVFCISNQSGIGRGIISWSELESVNTQMNQLLAQAGQWLDQISIAPFFTTKFEALEFFPSLRKPRPGMIMSNNWYNNWDFAKSVLIGDKATDIFMAMNCSIGKAILWESPATLQIDFDSLSELNQNRTTVYTCKDHQEILKFFNSN